MNYLSNTTIWFSCVPEITITYASSQLDKVNRKIIKKDYGRYFFNNFMSIVSYYPPFSNHSLFLKDNQHSFYSLVALRDLQV